MAEIGSKKLYDKDGVQFYPESKAEHIISNALGTLSSVSADLAYINNRITNALKDLSGGSQIEGDLGLTVKYGISASSTLSDMIQELGSAPNGTWSNTFLLPNLNQPYAWVALIFSWKQQSLDPIYFVTAIASFDRTQIMYTAIGDLFGEGGSLGGPTGYNTTTTVSDKNYSDIKWSYYFPGISAGTPFGYMAVRHIPAGTRESDALWKIALFAQYPGT